MDYRIELGQRLNAAFGLANTLPYILYPGEVFRSEDAGNSALNTPLFDRIIVESENGEYEFPHDPLIDFFYEKKKTETPTLDGDEVIETSGNKPIGIRIQGVLWNPEGNYPADQLAALREAFIPNAELKVVSSKILEYHGIAAIHCSSLQFTAIEGFQDSEAFMLTAREIKPVELELLEQDIN